MMRTILYGIAAGVVPFILTWIVLPNDTYIETALGYMFLAAGTSAIVAMVLHGIYRYRRRS